MISPTRKNLIVTNLPKLAAQILATPNFNFAGLSTSISFPVAAATYGVSQAEYNHLFLPDFSNIDGVCGPDQAPTLTNSPNTSVASNMNNFVAWVKTQF